MTEKDFHKISKDLDSIKKLLALLLRKQDVRGDAIANALGITEGRLSQMISPKRRPNKLKSKGDNHE